MGIYDSGSNVSLINSKLIRLKGEEKNIRNNIKLLTINGVQKTKGLTTIKIKIFKIEKKIDVYIVDGKNFRYDFLIGLDTIKEFSLIQNKNLKIEQNSEENFTNENFTDENEGKKRTL